MIKLQDLLNEGKYTVYFDVGSPGLMSKTVDAKDGKEAALKVSAGISGGAKIKKVVNWFENQPIDKGYIFGLRCYYPEVKIKGYQGFIISYDYNFNVIPTPYEVENKLCVDEVLVMGKKLTPYFKNINVNVAPAFRFSFLTLFTSLL